MTEGPRRGGMDEAARQSEWHQWLANHAPRFLLFARQQARSEADAQDLVQEAVVEAAQRRGDGTPPDPALVLATIRRRAIDQARRDDRRAGGEGAAAKVAARARTGRRPQVGFMP